MDGMGEKGSFPRAQCIVAWLGVAGSRSTPITVAPRRSGSAMCQNKTDGIRRTAGIRSTHPDLPACF